MVIKVPFRLDQIVPNQVRSKLSSLSNSPRGSGTPRTPGTPTSSSSPGGTLASSIKRKLVSLRSSFSYRQVRWTIADYEELALRLKELSNLESINALLDWDEQVMMPEGAAASRAAQRSTLAGVIHAKWTDPLLERLLLKLQPMINGGCVGHEVEDDCDGCQIGPFERAVVRDALKKQQKRAAVPARIAQRSAELASEGFQAWLKAREANDFSVLAPILEEWVALTQEKCQLIDSSQTPYDICLDEFERGMTSQRLDEVFSEVKKGLLPLLSSIRARGVPPSNDWIKGSYNPDEQAKLCLRICTDLGFMLDQGRLDVSAHPFTGETHPTDVRMTTRFKEGCLMEGLQGAIHETGHALYEQGRNMEYEGLPVSEPLSTGVHESQSLLWERMVAGGLPFCHYLLPVIKEHFPEFPATATAGDLYRAMNMVHDPSLVRTESDEVTYPMHVVLRYELERDLINGTIQVADLPRLWNEKMLEYLGCTPPDDARGILQDVHWSSGMFGYFPTYSLGAMYACQMFEQAKKELPDLEQDIAAGQFSQLRDWLYSEIHQVGSLYESGDHLMEKLTGSQLRPECFLQYLRDKYGPLYQLEEPQLAESINSADES